MNLRNAILNSAELKEKENDFLDSWASSEEGFIRDGIVNCEEYCNAPIKLLFVLKEVNGGKDWDLRDFLKDGGRKQTWNVVARWVEGIFNLNKDYPWNELEENNDIRRKEKLKYICAINLKKTSGKDVADNSIIYDTALNNREMLKNQISLYCPDIVICCGTDSAYIKVTEANPEWKMTRHGIWYYIEPSGTIVVAYSHPEARTKECMLHYSLIDAIKEIINNN